MNKKTVILLVSGALAIICLLISIVGSLIGFKPMSSGYLYASSILGIISFIASASLLNDLVLELDRIKDNIRKIKNTVEIGGATGQILNAAHDDESNTIS